jgi:hypothetical protein
MSYIPVRSVASGDKLGARDYNQFIRDNWAAGVPDLFTTKGDIATGTGDKSAARLGVGSNTAMLVSDNKATGGARWIVFPLAHVRATGANTNAITQGVWQSIWNYDGYKTEVFDTGSNYAASSVVFTAPRSGPYYVSAAFETTHDTYAGLTAITLAVYIDAAIYSVIAKVNVQSASATMKTRYAGSDVVWMAAGSTLEIFYALNDVNGNTRFANSASFFLDIIELF